MALFEALKVGATTVPNRVFMAPLTRIRATADTHLPGDLTVEHFAQRASSGLLIVDATTVAPEQSAFHKEPGIYNQDQVDAWSKVTKAVHDKGGRIFCQLVHPGRAAVPVNSKTAPLPVAPSAIGIVNHSAPGHFVSTGEKTAYTVPRALTDDELPEILGLFVKAAQNAVAAGFDGVEIHNANGYLLDEFLRSSSNARAAPYGGSLENRASFPLEVISAVAKAIGADRVGVRISPLNSYNDMSDEDPVALTKYFSQKMEEIGIAYLHVMRADFGGPTTIDVLTPARQNFKGVLVSNMGYTPEEAEADVAAGKIDAVAFGSAYMANPDLVERIKAGKPLAQVNWATVYGEGAVGYTDYPTFEQGEVTNK